ncbi:MAG: LysR family transcriptional regulator, partial [Minicystis sp.]
RTTRSVALTEAGLALLPAAEHCLSAAEDCARAARGETGPPPMEITIGTRQELGMSWLVPQITALSTSFPSLDIHLYFGSGPDLLLRVRTLEIDCAVTSSRFTDPKLESIRLHREDYAFVGAQTLLRKQPFTKDAHAAQHTLLDASAELPLFRYFRDAPGGGDRLHFGKIVRLGSIEAIRRRALEGAGVAVLPEYQIQGDLKRRAFQKIFPKVAPLHDYFRLVFRADDVKRPIYEKIAAQLQSVPLR